MGDLDTILRFFGSKPLVAEAVTAGHSDDQFEEILRNSGRYVQNVLGDGRCGFYAIMAQQFPAKFGGGALNGRGDAEVLDEAKEEIEKLKKDANLGGFFSTTIQNDVWINTNMFASIATTYGKCIACFHMIGASQIQSLQLVIPEIADLTFSKLENLFNDEVSRRDTDNGIMSAEVIDFMKKNCGISDGSTVQEAITALLLNPDVIALRYQDNHFQAVLPNETVLPEV
ncbi:MAG: hypothetical protein LBI56_00685 [Puniceicoccales bacterium]|jgi:hypothetical protein|nr:hypothetical protein [Puniceicoccales bacterium]